MRGRRATTETTGRPARPDLTNGTGESAGTDGTGGAARLVRRWPSLLGLAAATGLLAAGADRDTVAVVVVVAALCYQSAAALDRRWVAWAMVGGGGVVVTVGALLGLEPWMSIGLAALVLFVIGLLGRASRPTLTVETAGLLAYGASATAALFLAPDVGLVLVAVTLILHGVWDVVHHRRDVVVPRSLAEFCVLLDVPLGVGLLLLAVR